MVDLKELMMILDLHRQGLSVTAIARQLGMDRKTGKYIARPAVGEEPEQLRPFQLRAALILGVAGGDVQATLMGEGVEAAWARMASCSSVEARR